MILYKFPKVGRFLQIFAKIYSFSSVQASNLVFFDLRKCAANNSTKPQLARGREKSYLREYAENQGARRTGAQLLL